MKVQYIIEIERRETSIPYCTLFFNIPTPHDLQETYSVLLCKFSIEGGICRGRLGSVRYDAVPINESFREL